MKPLLAALLVAPLAACSPTTTTAPPIVTTASPEIVAPAPTAADIPDIHRARCGKCHVRVDPGQRSRDVFTRALARHRNRVHLSDGQWGALLDYLAPPA